MLTMASALDRTERQHGARPAIIDREGNLTWSQFADRVRRAAAMLKGLGVNTGDRFGIIALNGFRQAELIHAGYWLGAIPVPANFRFAPPEIAHVFQDAGCEVVAVDETFRGALGSEELSPWQARAFHLGPPSNTDMPQYEALLAESQPIDAHWSDEDDDATLLYTGGTTGRSKGVRLSHRNVFSNGMQCAIGMQLHGHENFLHVAPMFHSADLLGTGFTLVGASHSYLPQFSGANLLEAMQDYRVTDTMLTPTMIIMTLQEEGIDGYDLSSLEKIFYGSSPMAAEWIKRAIETFGGVEIEQGYGLTETSPILTILPMSQHQRALETGELHRLKGVGRAVVAVDLKIVDDDDNEVAVGEPGEVTVRGPNVTKGYLNLPEVTAEAFHDGWFHTGDVGRVDEEGYLYLLDRKKDLIITGGENVFSSEVEAVLYQHPKVHECAVVGVPDERYGEALFAAIVTAPGEALGEEEIITHCRGKIGGYKIPRRMAFLDELPKSAMGKILKNELRKTYGAAGAKKVS
jgi:long-chain acyl-CoA synthetase